MAIVKREDYDAMDREFMGAIYKMSANTLMAFPTGVDASRLVMNTSETAQSLTLVNPDVPRLSNGWENPLGRLNKNKSFRQVDGTWSIKAKINKFPNSAIYTLVLYNEDTDTYDMIEKQVAENLIEKFGYEYDTSVMDGLNVGDTITDLILYKSTAYDQNMNYMFGKNAKVMYSSSTDSIEDAIPIRKGWADGVKTMEHDIVTVNVNNNNIPINIYGNKEVYKSFPDIGEDVIDSNVITLRTVNKDHILSQFSNDALMHPTSVDKDYCVSESERSIIYDINVYYNGDGKPFPDTIFFKQLKYYYECGCRYADQMAYWSTFIKDSGSNYTKNVTYFKSKYQYYNNPEWIWCGKEKNRPIGYITVEFKVKSYLGVTPGSKFAGRYGDKGVCSKVVGDNESADTVNTAILDNILDLLGKDKSDDNRAEIAGRIKFVEDSEMPFTDDFPVDMILNASGAVRRLNPDQIPEVDINFQSYCVQKRIKSLPTLEEKAALAFEYMGMLNDAEYDFYYEMYESYNNIVKKNGFTINLEDRGAKEAFIKDIEENGFYIRKEIDSPIKFAHVCKVYEKYDWIKPLPIYIRKFGRVIRCINDAIVADKYMQVLKHNSNKNFSARSTYKMNKANIPVKDNTKRDNRSQYSKSPVRIGEAYNLMSAISGSLLAQFNIFMRSSFLGRKSLKKIMEAEGNPLDIKKLEIKDNYINTNADILNCKLKAIGLALEFDNSTKEEHIVLEDAIMPLRVDGYTIYDSPLKKQMYVDLFLKYRKEMESIFFVETYVGEKSDTIWDKLFNEDEEVKSLNLSEDIKSMLKAATCSINKCEI